MIQAVTAWRGDPKERKKMQFWVEYEDGDAMWVHYKPDLVSNAQYQQFVDSTPALFPLRFNTTDLVRMVKMMRMQPITTVDVGDTVYVDLRFIKGCAVFDQLELPDSYFTIYVCECQYVRWVGRGHLKLEAKCLVLDVFCRNWDSLDVYMFGSTKTLLPSMTLVNEQLCVRFPDILEKHNRTKLLRKYSS